MNSASQKLFTLTESKTFSGVDALFNKSYTIFSLFIVIFREVGKRRTIET